MSTNNPPLNRSIELASIKSDANFYLNLITNLLAKETAGILIFGLIPYIALFVWETYKYIEKISLPHAQILAHEYSEIIYASRLRIKHFDNRKKQVEEMLGFLNWVIKFNTEWHINKHKGFLSSWKRGLQDDLGIFTYDNHIIGSTHVGLINLGFEKDDLPTTSAEISEVFGPFSKSVAEEYGRLLALINSLPDFVASNQDTSCFSYTIQDRHLKYKDEKSEKYLEKIFNKNRTKEINLSLLLLLTAINYYQYVLRGLMTGPKYTILKTKFITLFHTISSLEKLQNYCYQKDILTDASKGYFREILQHKDLTLIKRQTKFRNILVHYQISGIPESNLSLSIDLYGLTEYFFKGKNSDELDYILNNQMERVSTILEEWLD